jgi:hypothetical protein
MADYDEFADRYDQTFELMPFRTHVEGMSSGAVAVGRSHRPPAAGRLLPLRDRPEPSGHGWVVSLR